MNYVDTHSHLSLIDHSSTQEILDRAKAAGVQQMITVSTDESSWEANREFAKQYPHVYYSLGMHPHDATRWIESASQFSNYFTNSKAPEKCVAIGEIGLDFHYEYSPKEIQISVFESQLSLAKTLNLPVIVHCRDAFDALFSCIRNVGFGSKTGVMHCFTGSTPNAKDAIDLGMKVSFSGIVTFKKAQALRDTAKALPLSEIVIETDCPYLSPEPFRGKPNEPSFLPLTAKMLAAVHSVSEEEIAQITTQNAVEFFQLNPL